MAGGPPAVPARALSPQLRSEHLPAASDKEAQFAALVLLELRRCGGKVVLDLAQRGGGIGFLDALPESIKLR